MCVCIIIIIIIPKSFYKCPCKHCFCYVLHILMLVQNSFFFSLFFCNLSNDSWDFSFDSSTVWKCVCDTRDLCGSSARFLFFLLSLASLCSAIFLCLQTADIPLTTDGAALAPTLFVRIPWLRSFPVIFFPSFSTAYGFQGIWLHSLSPLNIAIGLLPFMFF